MWRPAAGGLSGLLLLAAFPPIDRREAALVALIPLLVALRATSARVGALTGAAFAMGFFGPLLYWIFFFGWMAWAALVASQVAMLAAFGALGAWVARTGPAGRVAGLPLLWVGIELVRSHWPLGGFPWGLLGYSQHSGGPLLPLARVGGVFLISAAVVAVNALLIEALGSAGRRRAFAVSAAIALLALPGIVIPSGLAGPQTGSIEIAIVQGNVARGAFEAFAGARDEPVARDLTIVEDHARLTIEALADDPPDLVIWPENAIDRDPFRDPRAMEPLQRAIAAVGVPFLVGTILDAGPEGENFANANLLFGAGGGLAARYDKQRLVPFGEYVPWPALRRTITALEQIRRDGIPGEREVLFEVAGAGIGSVICYESAYPGMVRRAVAGGAEILVVTTNNASYRDSPASRQHMTMSRLRAVEHGRPVAHAAISGISAVIMPDGGVQQQSGLFEQAVLRASLPLAGGTTPYTRHGSLVELVLAAGAAAAATAGLALRIGRAARRRTPEDAGETTDEQRSNRVRTPAIERDPGGGPGTPGPGAASLAAGERHPLAPPRPLRRPWVILPTYNEAGTIREVATGVLDALPEAFVLVVDDASPDGTGGVVEEMAATEPRIGVLHRPSKGGLGPAYRAGFAHALAHGADAVIEMDADLSHDPRDAARLVEAAGGADVVIGSRYVAGGAVRNWSRGRRTLSRAGNLYARLLLGFGLTDATSGLRCYRQEALKSLPLDAVRTEGYAFQVEMAWRAWVAGFTVSEIPITFTERRAGASKMSRRIILEALDAIARWALEFRRPPLDPNPLSVTRGA